MEIKGSLNVHRFDPVRFLTTDERSAVREYNKAKGLEKRLTNFDQQEPLERHYPLLVSFLKHSTDEASAKYFKLRKLARERMYRIKNLRRAQKRSDTVLDSEFSTANFMASTEGVAQIVKLCPVPNWKAPQRDSGVKPRSECSTQVQVSLCNHENKMKTAYYRRIRDECCQSGCTLCSAAKDSDEGQENQHMPTCDLTQTTCHL